MYWEPDVYQRELDTIFGRSWLFVGHESMIPEVGDYITNFMGDDPVIVCRDKDRTIRVFLNKCRHRGNKVCLFDKGNTAAFRCSYHGWTYGINGTLAAVPQLKESYAADFPRAELGLQSSPNVAVYKGLIFANWDAAAPALEDYLGADLLWYWDHFFLDDPAGIEALPGRHRYIIPGNWKLLAENFGGDMYHFGLTHASVIVLNRAGKSKRILGSAGNPRDDAYYSAQFAKPGQPPHGLLQLSVGNGVHAADLEQAAELSPRAVAWVEARHARRLESLAAYETRPSGFYTANIWPNLSMNGFGTAIYGRTLLQWHPRGPDSTEVWQWCFVEKSAPPEVKEQMAFILTHGQAAAGMIAPDDDDNFRRIRDVLHTNQGRHVNFNYELAREADERSLLPELPGQILPALTEGYHRSFYRYWHSLIDPS
jgi:phenylpropionate dioxygenase-like ring-hydroxylating dioxygenase large terminal subunit